MDWSSSALLLVAGVAMGFVNNLAGAGGLIGLMAFDLVSGMPTTTANVSLRPAAVALTLSGLLAFRSKGQAIPARAWRFGLVALPGAVAGALLAVTLPPFVYRAALVAVIAIVLRQLLRRRRPGTSTTQKAVSPAMTLVLFTLVGVHMGFLQVAVGLLTMAVLTHVHSRDLVAVNAAKMAVLTVTAVASTACLTLSGEIDWPPALSLAAGAAVGSFAAGRWSVRRGHGAIRAAVLVVCGLCLLRLGVQLYTGA